MKEFEQGVFDRHYWPKEKKAFRCSRDLESKLPEDVLENCTFEKGASLLENVTNMCRDMKNVLGWALAGCHVDGDGNKRARRRMQNVADLCKKMIKKLDPKKPIPDSNCPYDGDNTICDGSDKCGLAHFGSCVQLKVLYFMFSIIVRLVISRFNKDP